MTGMPPKVDLDHLDTGTEELAPPTGTWDWGTMMLTTVAGAAIVGLVTLQLTGSTPGAVLGGLFGGAVIGLLTGYRPLHERDAGMVDQVGSEAR